MYIVLLYRLAPKLRKWLMWNYICSLPGLIFILLLYEHIYEFMQAAADSQVDVIPHGGSGVYHLPWCNSASTAWTVQLSRPGQLAPLEAPLWTIVHSVGVNGRQRMSTLLYCLGEQAEAVLNSTNVTDADTATYSGTLKTFHELWKL